MVVKCPTGTQRQFRVKSLKSGQKLRLEGCARKGKFIKGGVKKVKKLRKKK